MLLNNSISGSTKIIFLNHLFYNLTVVFIVVSGGRFLHAPEKVIALYKGTATIRIRYNITSDAQDAAPVTRKFKQLLVEYAKDETLIATGTTAEFTLNASPFKERANTNRTMLDANNELFELTIGDLAYNDDIQIKTILFYQDPSTTAAFDTESTVTNLIVEGIHTNNFNLYNMSIVVFLFS